jgi:hypothetical protein
MALILAVLYFGLIELLMLDSSRELAEARRYRARVVALTLAENGAELAAFQMVVPEKNTAEAKASNWQGEITGKMTKNAAGEFALEGTGKAPGVVPMKAKVTVSGRIIGSDVQIYYTGHSQ